MGPAEHTFLCTFNFLNISVASKRCWFSKILYRVNHNPNGSSVGGLSSLLCIESQQGQIQEQCNPVAVDQEQKRQESMYSGLRNDVGVQAIA
jgi:hypothetical protein